MSKLVSIALAGLALLALPPAAFAKDAGEADVSAVPLGGIALLALVAVCYTGAIIVAVRRRRSYATHPWLERRLRP